MKKHLLAGLMIAAAAIGTAHAQSISAPADRAPRVRTEKPVTPLPPRAPAKYYGTPDETVTYDQNNPSRITGIILFGIRW